MKILLRKLKIGAARSWAKVGAGAAAFALVISVQLAGMSTPAHALKLYAQQNGNAPCSTCHSRKGLANGTMYPFTRIGAYFKANGRMPPRPVPQPAPPPFVPPPVVGPGPIAPPPFNPPPVAQRWTCSQAQAHLRNRGYSRISVRDCRGATYKFTASRSGVRYSMRMKSRTGRIYQVRRISPGFNPPPVVGPPVLPPPVLRRLTCGQARNVLINRGYSRIRTRDCRGRNYAFDANRGGLRYNIRMRSASGRIYRVRRVQVFNPAPPPVFRPPAPPVFGGRLSCNQAVRKVRSLGYHSVVAKDCSGNRYTLFGISRGVWYRLRVRASSGRVYKITRARP